MVGSVPALKSTLVQVVYKILDMDKLASCTCGYTYRSSRPLTIGDIVLVPGTYVDGYNPPPKEATVVATHSDYSGPVDYVIKVLVPASKRK